MFRVARNGTYRKNSVISLFSNKRFNGTTTHNLPAQADVVIIGGGVAGCNTLYHLTKKGVKALLLEKGKITSGTTWHTCGLIWRVARPSDVDIKMLQRSRELFMSIEKETGHSSGWINNGGLLIAKTDERLQEYKRLHTLGHFFGVDTQILSPSEAAKLSPLLNPNSFKAALYSPGDGGADPSQYTTALLKASTSKGGQVFENCPVTKLQIDHSTGVRKIKGIETESGVIKTSTIVNAAGIWSRNITQMAKLEIPLTAMKHAYIVTDSIPEAKGTPNIRDHDGSVYMRIQGESVLLGGYENNPEILKEAPDDFQFSLYDLDYSIFNVHLENAKELCPALANVGIKSTVCGPESFTPDHKPILGEDPKLLGLYHCNGFNSGGMMFSGGCAEQLAVWITEGRPNLPMFQYDIRRFTPSVRTDRSWIVETSHESYAKNYDIVFPHDQPLAGRNHKIDPFHEALVAAGAVMQHAQGWERPGYFIKDLRTAPVRGYDWKGNYDHVKNEDKRYEKELEGDHTFGFSKHHHIIGEEALAVRKNVGLFDLSYFTKMYLTGPDAQEAADWLFTANTDQKPGRVVYTCSLNSKGGVEADVTITKLSEGVGTLVGPILKGTGFYIVAGGATGYQTMSQLRKQIIKKSYKSVITDITDRLGILSIQGPKAGGLIQSLTEFPVTDSNFPIGMSHLIKINDHVCRAMRISFVGELGYELHIPSASCLAVYNKVIEAGKGFDLVHAGFRALYSLSLEKGYHLWNSDLRIDDNPVEANLAGICRKNGQYQGKKAVDDLNRNGCKKRRVFLTLEDEVPLYGHETIWRDDKIVGYLRRGDYGYSLDCSIGVGYVEHPKGKVVEDEYLKSGNYQIEVMDKKYKAQLYLKSPFDPNNLRPLGQYDQNFQEQQHFED